MRLGGIFFFFSHSPSEWKNREAESLNKEAGYKPPLHPMIWLILGTGLDKFLLVMSQGTSIGTEKLSIFLISSW